MFNGNWHLNLRRRIFQKLEPYPSPDALKRSFDTLMYGVGIAAPLMMTPQLVHIWVNGQTAGLSLITWSSHILFSGLWLTYGVIHDAKPVIVSNTLWLVANILIVTGILTQGGGLAR